MRRAAWSLALTGLLGCSAADRAEQVGRVGEPIIGGRLATADEMVSTVALLDVEGVVRCSGTLIAPTVVLTGAHCLKEQDPETGFFPTELAPADLSVVAGVLNTGEQGAKRHAVAELVTGDFDGDFETDPGDNLEGLARADDIGLVLLSDPVDEVAPSAILDPDRVDVELELGTILLLSGYGLDTDQASGGTLGRLRLAAGVFHRHNGYEMHAAGDGVDICPGDSGGPAYLQGAGPTVVVGVASRGIESSPKLCGDGSIWTLAPAYEDWIIEQSAGAYQPPPPPSTTPPPDDSCSLTRLSVPGRGRLGMAAAIALLAVARRRRRR